MSLKLEFPRLRSTGKVFPFMGIVLVMLQLSVPTAKALEVLSAQELASHCTLLKSEPDGVDLVVADLAAVPQSAAESEPAMEVVYNSLQQHYPCNP